jgi:hypothetical protein
VYTYTLAEKNSFLIALDTQFVFQIDELETAVQKFVSDYNLGDESTFINLRDQWNSFFASTKRSNLGNILGLVENIDSPKQLESRLDQAEQGWILVPLNHPSDGAVLQGSPVFTDYLDFLEGILEIARKFPDRHFKFKVHPIEKIFDTRPEFKSSLQYLEEFGVTGLENCSIEGARTANTLDSLLEKTSLVICYTSTVAITSAISGIPTMTCSFSAQRHPSLLSCPTRLEEISEWIETNGQPIWEDKKLISNRPRNALAYSMLHFIHAQIETGLFHASDVTLGAGLHKEVGFEDLLSNEYLNFIGKTISQKKKFVSNRLANCEGQFFLDR